MIPGHLASYFRPKETIAPKNDLLIPFRLALALQEDGWIVRQPLIWNKLACMPESVTDRCTTSHEYILMLAKTGTYYFDQDAIREPLGKGAAGSSFTSGKTGEMGMGRQSRRERIDNPAGRNARSVWTLPPSPLGTVRTDDGETLDHYASFPISLPTRCILAATSEKGCCPRCGKAWERVVERTAMEIRRTDWGEKAGNRTAPSGTMTRPPSSRTIGWRPGCTCEAGEPVPCVVADCFSGAATTGLAALQLGRRYIGAELNEEYIKLSAARLRGAASQTSIFDAGEAAS